MISKNEHSILEAALETTEVIADVIIRGDLLADIPIIGTAVKICKAVDSVRDRAFIAKLALFATELDRVPIEEKQRMKEKLAQSPNDSKKIGETLFLVLDKITDLGKPALLAMIFLAYVDEVITKDELRRMSQAVDLAFADDLHIFLSKHKLQDQSEEYWMQYLAPAGLTRAVGGTTLADVGKIYYEVAPLGHKLRNAYFHGQNKRSGVEPSNI